MQGPTQLTPRQTAFDTDVLGAYLPVPGFGVLPVNAFLIRAPQPVLVDTGLAALRDDFMADLRSLVDPADLRWIWITHADADHLGNLEAVLAEAPEARIVTTYLGMGKMAMAGLPAERMYLLNPGQGLDIGDRRLVAVVPPSFDAPETTGAFDSRTGALFSADCFGCLMTEPAETAAAIGPQPLAEGCTAWAAVDAPWLAMTDPNRWRAAVDRVRDLDPAVILSAHLPPAEGMNNTLLAHLVAAREAPPFVGPDQAAIETMMRNAA